MPRESRERRMSRLWNSETFPPLTSVLSWHPDLQSDCQSQKSIAQKSEVGCTAAKMLCPDSYSAPNFLSEIFKGGGIQLCVEFSVLDISMPKVRLDCSG